MKSEKIFFNTFYILPFFLIINKGIANVLLVLMLLYMTFKLYKLKDEFFEFFRANGAYFYPLVLLNFYLIFNTLIISETYLYSIGRLLIFNFFSLFFIFFQFFINYNNKYINYKKLSLFFLIIFSFLIFDTYYQFFFRTDLLGYEIITFRLTGPFGNEEIVGAFLFKFMFFIFYFILNNHLLKNYILFFIAICLFIIILSGERIAAIYGIFFIIIFIVSNIKAINSSRQILIIFLFILIAFFQLIKVTYESKILNHMNANELNKPLEYIPENRLDEITLIMINRYTRNIFSDLNYDDSSYFKLFKSGIEIWKDNKLFGVGLKNYRKKCTEMKLNIDYECSTHPHNLLFELLSEIGLIGTLLFFYAIFINIFRIIKMSNIPFYLFFSLSPSLIPFINTSFFNSFSMSIFLIQLILIIIISYSHNSNQSPL